MDPGFLKDVFDAWYGGQSGVLAADGAAVARIEPGRCLLYCRPKGWTSKRYREVVMHLMPLILTLLDQPREDESADSGGDESSQ